MKPIKDLILFLTLEVLSVVWAAACFTLIPAKVVAGALAGGFFLLSGLFMLARIVRWKKWWEAWVLYPLLIYLFGCTIPMLWVRFSSPRTDFAELKIFGLSGPEFHHVSSSVLGLLTLVTLAETMAAFLARRTRVSN